MTQNGSNQNPKKKKTSKANATKDAANEGSKKTSSQKASGKKAKSESQAESSQSKSSKSRGSFKQRIKEEDLGSQFRAAFQYGQEKFVQTTRLGRKMIEGSLLSSELKHVYQELGEKVYQEISKSDEKGSLDTSDYQGYVQRIQDVKKKIREEEQEINNLKKSWN
jgi:hypothetical protein